MLQESPEDIFLNYAYAMELLKEDEIELAQKAFAKVRELNPDYVPAYFQEAQMLSQDDRIEEARSLLESGIKVARKTGDDHALGEMTEYMENL
ncbi:tetratricopeptide repeat protein [Thalassoglobus sp.]|uniref:tetratricopeptide repeat protein n=1 Tax=Thalassoglobus sp. TaxID=2795869 RepID=UPI003AA8ABE8